MDAATFGIKHKTTGLFFSGFDASGQPTWALESQARHFDKLGAQSQASLFRCFDIRAQLKPVTL